MSELGCKKDGSFHNLEVDGFATINNTTSLLQQRVVYYSLKTSVGTSTFLFWQPPRSIIISIELVVVDSPVVAIGDIGYHVGTSSGGNQLITASTNNILNGGTTIANGAYYNLGSLNGDTTFSQSSPTTTLRVNTTIDHKAVYLHLTNTTVPTNIGNFAWIINFKQF